MRILLRNFLYFHGFFIFLLYLISTFVTIIVLEYKLKNQNLKHTIAAFACMGLSAIAAYYIPIAMIHTKHESPRLQLISIMIALAVQIFFWWLWFRERFRKYVPALAMAFGLSVLISLLTYNAFIGYMSKITRAGLKRIVTLKN